MTQAVSDTSIQVPSKVPLVLTLSISEFYTLNIVRSTLKVTHAQTYTAALT